VNRRRSYLDIERPPARQNLMFPPIDVGGIGSNQLLGFHSFLNWLKPELTFAPNLKLSLLLCDKIIVETYFPTFPEKRVDELVKDRTLTRGGAKKLIKLLLPITSLVPEFNASDLWKTEDIFLKYCVEYYIDEEYGDIMQLSPDEKSLYDIRYDVTVAAFENWFALSQQVSCFFIPNEWESKILHDFLKFLNAHEMQMRHPTYREFETVVTKLLPSVDHLSLEEVLTLREHEYFASFRFKTKELADRVAKIDDVAEVTRTIRDEERKDLDILIKLFRPKPKLKLLRALISNIPIPLPFIPNPVAVYDSVETVNKERNTAREFGWLYFIRDYEGALEGNRPQHR
jgi:hypothetical protein